MTRTAKKMFKDIGYKYSEKYITDNITNEKVLERIQYEKGCETIRFYIRGKFWGKSNKKGVLGSKYEYAYATMEETEAIVQQCKELNWINSESKEETNFEHYFEKIKELVSMHFRNPQAIANGLMAVSDEDILCTGLITDAILDWCKNPYKNRDYCLSEFEYELLESYTNDDEEVTLLCIKDIKVLQNMQKKGYFRNVDNYTPIRDILKCSEIKKGEKEDEVHCWSTTRQ